MIGLVFIYFAGKAFYDLADTHGKSKWTFGILGVVSYYFGLLSGAFVIGLVVAYSSPGAIDDSNSTIWGLAAIPIGVLACWLFYKFLERIWSRPTKTNNELLDGDLINEDSQE